MATGAVDRTKWAAVVRRLMDKHAGGKKATFAKLVGVDPRTVSFWLDEVYTVREAIVRQVADKTAENAIELLVEVGVYSRDELPRLTDEQIDEEQRAVLDRDDLDDEQKVYILQELDAMRTTDDRLLEEQRKRDRQRRTERLDVLIERARVEAEPRREQARQRSKQQLAEMVERAKSARRSA